MDGLPETARTCHYVCGHHDRFHAYCIDETQRRRELQQAYNQEHGITPKTIQKAVRDLISISKEVAKTESTLEKDPESMSREELEKLIAQVQKQMKSAAADLNFEMAAELRDKMIELKKIWTI